MKYIKQFAIIITVSFLGEILNLIIPLPIPASIWGLALMLVLLCLKIVPLGAVKDCATFLVSLMQIMFIPAAVGLIGCSDSLRTSWLTIVISIVLLTPVVFFVSGKTTDVCIKHFAKQADTEKKEENGNV